MFITSIFIFNLANFRIVKPQIVGKTTRIVKWLLSSRQIIGKTLKVDNVKNKADDFQKQIWKFIGVIIVSNRVE